MTDIQWLGKQQKVVFLALEKLGESTDAELAEFLKIDNRSVGPRRYELLKQDYIEYSRHRICNVTKMKVKAWVVKGVRVKIKNSMEEFF
jgi:Mn-dependent DtxR family transcriptional regulator